MPPASGPRKVKVKVKKAKPSVLTAPLGNAAAPIIKAQHQAHQKTQRAQRKVEARTTIPYVPKLKHPTSAQRGAAQSQVASSLHRQHITTPAQVKALPKAQRVRVNRAIGYANTNRKLVASMPSNVTERAQILPAPAHKRVGIPGVASIDLTATSRAIGKKLAGNQISALLKAVPAAAALTAKQKGIVGLSGRALQDAIDLPANTVTSTYQVSKEAATGHPGKAAKMLADPIVETVKHPVKSFSQHPLDTALIFRGGKGAIGHSTGRVLRTGVAGRTLKQAASIERETKTLPNARVTTQRRYSGDVTAKAVQVAHHKVKVRRAAKKGKPHPDQMSAQDVRTRVNEDVQAAKIVSSHNEGTAARAAKKAIGSKPTAAVTLAAKGVTNSTRADLEKYLSEIRAQHPTLATEAERQANEHLQSQIVASLKNHNEQAVHSAAKAYSDLHQPVETQVVAHHLVNPAKAEETRFAGPAVRQGASVAQKRTAVVAGKQAREGARRVKVRARQDVAKADQTVQSALADARVSNVRQKSSPALVAAEKSQRVAVRDLARLNKQRRGTKETTVTNAAVLRQARVKVRSANAKVITERARIRGVAPKEADRLLNALAQRDVVRVKRTQAVAGHKVAVSEHRASKAAPFANGRPVTVQDVREARGPNAIEPAFVTESPIQRRSAALPSEKPSIPVREMRTGEAVRKGTFDAHPATLIEQSMASSRLVDAAKAREKFIEDFGYRDNPKADVRAFKTRKSAEQHAAASKDSTGVDWSPVQRQDGTYTVIPREALSQLTKHEQALNVHPAMKVVTSQWRKNVLAFSPRWLTGNVLEAALRSLVAGAGPTSWVTGRNSIRALEKIDPEAAQQLRARAIGGGNYTTAERVSRERVAAEDLAGFTKAVHTLRQAPVARHLADAYGWYTRQVFNNLNGRLESQFQTAMLGRALRDSPLMADKVIKTSAKAAEDAAKGLKNTDAQVELGRQVDRMYGKYQKFGPGLRNAISTYTPFMSWTINALNFLYHVLPADHPVLTSLITSASLATEDYRKKHGLFLDFFGQTKGQLPPWLQGSITGKGGSHLRVSRYTPFGLLANDGGTPLGGLESLLLPQLSEITKNLSGQDWTGKKSLGKSESGWRDILAAASSFVEGQIPLASQGANIAGVKLPNVADSTKVKKGVKVRVRSSFDPFMYTQSKPSSGTSGGGLTQQDIDELTKGLDGSGLSQSEIDALIGG